MHQCDQVLHTNIDTNANLGFGPARAVRDKAWGVWMALHGSRVSRGCIIIIVIIIVIIVVIVIIVIVFIINISTLFILNLMMILLKEEGDPLHPCTPCTPHMQVLTSHQLTHRSQEKIKVGASQQS